MSAHPPFRSLLFTPGTRPERFAKALASGADAICLDLEDAVPPDGKAAARTVALDWLFELDPNIAELGGPAAGLRINALSTLEGFRDVVALADRGVTPDFVMVPKVAGPDELVTLGEILGFAADHLWPIVESARGLEAAPWIAAAPGVAGVLFGGADYSAEVGAAMDWDGLAYARGRLAAACGGAGRRQLLDVPYLDVSDAEGLAASTARVRALGFTGRACIHPAQVAIVNVAFTPTPAEVSRARAVLDALAAANGSAALLDGKLVERPLALAAERTLARAKLAPET